MANVYDEMIKGYESDKKQTQNQMNELTTEKQNALDSYEQMYNDQLTGYENLMNQQQNYIDTWAETQKENQQKQTDYEIGLINQNKEEAERSTNIERGNAYIDYQKGLNQFGGSAETLASQGLGGTGYAKNQEIAMNITYQNRLSAANTALQKANVQYDNQIQQALLNNDVQLAEIALQQLSKQYDLALKGFEYKTTLQNNRLTYIQGINDSYFNKQNTLQNRLDTYNSNINSVKATKYQEQLANTTYKSSGGSGGSGGNGAKQYGNGNDKEKKQQTTTNNSNITNVNSDNIANIAANVVGSAINRARTATSSPALSGRAASTWYAKNIGGKSYTADQLKQKLLAGYNANQITAADVQNILRSYGLK